MLPLLAVLAVLAVVGLPPAAAAQVQLPLPDPLPGRSVVQFVNESSVMVLLGCVRADPGRPWREGTWELPPGDG